MKKEKDGEFYSLKKILEYNATYNFIMGMRSNGKTFACLEYILDDYIKNKRAGAYIRRQERDIIGEKGRKVFDNFVYNAVKGNMIEKKTNGEFNDFVYVSREWKLCYKNKDTGEIERYDLEPFCYAFAITQEVHYKSVPYPTIYTACFDEVITRDGYLEDEFVKFTSLLSTIIRQKKGFKIFMCGNTINKYCPYFEEMGLKHVKDMKVGTIDLYSYGNKNLKVAIEYTEVSKKVKEVNEMYFAFDNPKLRMITDGEWEIDIYPHLPFKYKRDEIEYTFYIEFNDEKFTGEVIVHDDKLFTYIHPKTTPIREDEYPVYTTKIVPDMNYTRKFFKPRNNVEKMILNMYQNEQFYYQDNSVGDTIHNYLEWSSRL